MATEALPTVLVPVCRSKDGVNIKEMMVEAEKIIKEYAEQDKAATLAVVEVTEKIVTNEKYKDVTTFTAGSLAKMALGVMQEIPTDKLCAETEVRVKAYLLGQPEKFLFIARGRNSGFHLKDRLKKEDLEKLVKEKATSDAAAAKAAAAAGETAVAAE